MVVGAALGAPVYRTAHFHAKFKVEIGRWQERNKARAALLNRLNAERADAG